MEVKASAEFDARMRRAFDKALAQKENNHHGKFMPVIWSIIMRTGFIKWAATAAALVIATAIMLTKSAPAAFGIEQVIAAYNNVHFLHVKSFRSVDQEPDEFWIQSDEQGHVTKARYYLPVTQDGIKLITWTPERSEIWFKTKHGFVTFQTKRIQPWMQSIIEQSQPDLVMKRLLEAQKAGKVEIEESKEPQHSARIVVTYKNEAKKEIYLIDPKTELVTRVETYNTKGAAPVLKSKQEFLDYNAPVDEKFFSLRGELPKDVRISDRLNQIAGVAQGDRTDEQAAVETLRQFCQALIDKDYKKAGLVLSGELEEFAKADFGKLNVTKIVSVGPPVAQPDWDKHGFKVPCELETLEANGQKSVWRPDAYVRPGDDEMHPDYWNITGGSIFNRRAEAAAEGAIKKLPDNAKYEKLTPKETAAAFFQACSEKNWMEFSKFWPLPVGDERFERFKEYLGGLEVISIGEAFRSNEYAGWYVPYEIKLPPVEINVRVSNTNSAGRYVITGVFDRHMKLSEELKWSQPPAVLTDNDSYQKMTPTEVVKAYFGAILKEDWSEMAKFAPRSDVDTTKRQMQDSKIRGEDIASRIPVVQSGEPVWSAEQSSYFVKCHISGVRKWNLAVRNDNPANRYVFDGGL